MSDLLEVWKREHAEFLADITAKYPEHTPPGPTRDLISQLLNALVVIARSSDRSSEELSEFATAVIRELAPRRQ